MRNLKKIFSEIFWIAGICITAALTSIGYQKLCEQERKINYPNTAQIKEIKINLYNQITKALEKGDTISAIRFANLYWQNFLHPSSMKPDSINSTLINSTLDTLDKKVIEFLCHYDHYDTLFYK